MKEIDMEKKTDNEYEKEKRDIREKGYTEEKSHESEEENGYEEEYKHEKEHMYDAIINLPHPSSAVHPRMARTDRAAQFASFAVLKGYDADTVGEQNIADDNTEFDG